MQPMNDLTTDPQSLTRVTPPQSGRSTSVGLGWFSIGLGLAELAVPGPLARLIGVPDRPATRWLLRAIGGRELAAALGLLSQPRRAGWLWGRVAGDVIDLSLLGAALLSPRTNRVRAGAAMAAVAGAVVLDAWAGRKALARGDEPVLRTITIRKPPGEVYACWRNLPNLTSLITDLESVEVIDDRRSRWRARVPAGVAVSWEAEITQDLPGEIIAWRTSGAGLLRHDGTVRFVPTAGGRSTEVHVSIRTVDDQGAAAVLKSMVAPAADVALGTQLEIGLGRLKQLLEIGHVMRSDASLHRGTHPARPATLQEQGAAS